MTSQAEDTRANRRTSPVIAGETIDGDPDAILSCPAAETEPVWVLPAARDLEPSYDKDDRDKEDGGEDGGVDQGYTERDSWEADSVDSDNNDDNNSLYLYLGSNKTDQSAQTLLRGSPDMNDQIASLRPSLGESDNEDVSDLLLLSSEQAADKTFIDGEPGGIIDSDDDPTVLLAAQLIESTSPSIDFAYELGRHLMQFQGCPDDSHLTKTSEHDRIQTLASSPAHLTLDELDKHLIRARVPCVIDKRQPLSASQRAALPQPNWAQIFDGYEASEHEDSVEADQPVSRPRLRCQTPATCAFAALRSRPHRLRSPSISIACWGSQTV
jgi:hypothetical protein